MNLYRVALPLNRLRLALISTMAVAFAAAVDHIRDRRGAGAIG